ncbi:hypothetical protein F4802DRAFT_546269 [Xylaria palmicola]|nr:hypothetical protein F4802DRAFT_546269 [Xylaria palmicola]
MQPCLCRLSTSHVDRNQSNGFRTSLLSDRIYTYIDLIAYAAIMMRSRPFTSPSPLAKGLSVSSHGRSTTSIASDEAVPLTDSDPQASHLLPRRQRRHRVRIQGRLAVVRTVSVTTLRRQAKNRDPTVPADMGLEDGRGHSQRRHSSFDGSEAEDENEDEADDGDDDDVVERDAQFRGYGIGGAGNIRRPTDVTSSASPSVLSLIRISSSPPAVPLHAMKPPNLRWRMASLLHDLRGLPGKK